MVSGMFFILVGVPPFTAWMEALLDDLFQNLRHAVILRVYLDSTSQQSIEVPITPNTTCRDIINCCEQEQNCHLAELWRGCERPVNDEERPFEILQQWGQHKHEVRFYLRHETPLYSDGHYDQVSDTRRNGIGTYDLTEPPQVPNDLSLSELQEMAVRQQQQIESQQQQLVAKEQRLKFLRQQEQKHQQMASENERLRKLREKVEAQELKLKKLRALRGQLDQHKTNNGSLTIELESIKAMFNEKEKELTLAVAKVEELHRQMEELKKGRMNGLNTSRSAAAALELERLRNELMMRNKLNSEQTEKINKRREYYNEKTNEVQLMDRRIEELQQRLRKKRSLQQEQSSNQNLPPRRPMNRPAANSNIAAVEPYIKVTPKEIKTTEDMYSKEFIPNKQDPKYQSLPSHTINKKPDPVKPGGESAPVIYDMKVDDTTVNGLKKGDNNNIPNYNPTQNKVKPVAQSLANFVARPFGSTSSTAFTGRVLNISTLEPRTAGSGQSSPAISDSSLTQYPPSTTAPSSQFTHSTPDMARPSHVAAPVSTSTKPVLSAGPAVPRSPMSSSKPPEVSPIYGNNTPTLNSYQSTPVSSNTVQSRPQVAASSPAPSSPVTKTIDVPPPLEPRGVAPVRPSIASSPSAKNPPSVTSAGPTPDTSVTSVNSALSMLMGNSTTSTPPKTTSTYRYASRSAISNLYMNKMGSSAMDQYRMNMNRLYSNTSQKQDTTSDLSQQQNSPTPKLPPKASSPTKPSPGDRPVSPLKAGSPIRSIPPGGFDPIDKAHFKPHTPKALHRRHSAGDSDDSAMKALARAAQQAQSDQQENNANNNNNHNGALRRTLFEKIPEKEVPVESKKPVARMTARKTNLKSKSSKPKKRRVSFDPLALLLDASLEGELDLVKKTATQVDNPSEPNDEGITALHNAICAGHYEIVKFLVEFGCDVNSPDSDGWTPLHCAASCNNLPMVKLLVEHGACIFATTISDQETAAEKCEEDEDGFDGCSEYLYSIQEKLGIMNGGAVFSVFDYQANNNDEISFKEGDKLVVLRKGDETEKEWWWARRKDREGYIPRNLLGLQPRVKPVNGALNSPE